MTERTQSVKNSTATPATGNASSNGHRASGSARNGSAAAFVAPSADDARQDRLYVAQALREADRLFAHSAVLRHIAAWADARGSARVAVLTQVLMRTTLAVSPRVVIPAHLGGAHVGLSLLNALAGESSGGKGRAEAVGREAVALRAYGQVQRLEPVTPSTGEGLVSVFASAQNDPLTRRPTTTIHTPAALLSFKDIEAFDALARRTGSTLTPTLLSLYMGDTLGFVTREAARRVILPAHTVVGGVSAGVQPAKGNVLLSDEMRASGIPQRLLWTPVRAGRRVERRTPPEPITVDVPDYGITTAAYDVVESFTAGEGVDPATLVEVGVTEGVAEEVHAADRQKDLDVFGAMPDGQDPLAGHTTLTRLKVAAALAALHGEPHINGTWWEMAGIVMEVSMVTQNAVEQATQTAERLEEQRSGVRMGYRQAAADTTRDTERVNALAGRLHALVGDDWGTVNWRARLTKGQQAIALEAFDLLIDAGKIEVRDYVLPNKTKTQQYRRICIS